MPEGNIEKRLRDVEVIVRQHGDDIIVLKKDLKAYDNNFKQYADEIIPHIVEAANAKTNSELSAAIDKLRREMNDNFSGLKNEEIEKKDKEIQALNKRIEDERAERKYLQKQQEEKKQKLKEKIIGILLPFIMVGTVIGLYYFVKPYL